MNGSQHVRNYEYEKAKEKTGETKDQYLKRILEMKMKSAGTGVRTMLPPNLSKPEVEELPQRK